MIVHANVLCTNEGLVLMFLALLKVAFITIVENLIDENEICSRDVNIFNLDISYIT